MAKPNAPASLAHAAPSLIAEEVPASAEPKSPTPSPTRAHPIAPAPEPEIKDRALVIEGTPSRLGVLVTHGTVRHDGKRFAPGDMVDLPADLAKRLEAQGVAKIVRRIA